MASRGAAGRDERPGELGHRLSGITTVSRSTEPRSEPAVASCSSAFGRPLPIQRFRGRSQSDPTHEGRLLRRQRQNLLGNLQHGNVVPQVNLPQQVNALPPVNVGQQGNVVPQVNLPPPVNLGQQGNVVPQVNLPPPVNVGQQGPQGISGQNALDFLTANTPGPITGLSGLSSATTSILSPPTTQVPQGFANSSFVQKLQTISPEMKGFSAGSSLLTGGADVLSTLAEGRQIHKRGWGRFFKGLWASIKKPFGFHRDASGREAEDRSAAKRFVVNTATNVADLGLNQGPTAATSIASLTSHTLPTVLGPIAAGAGAGISSLVMARSLYRGHRAAKHQGNLETLINQGAIQDPTMQQVAAHHRDQMQKRKVRSRLGAAGALLGAVGGGLLLGGLLGASMLTPIGWALAAAGGLAAAALGAHKLYRYHQKRKRGILGVERQQRALELHTAANGPIGQARTDAHAILTARGIDPLQVQGPEGLEFLRRKAESW